MALGTCTIEITGERLDGTPENKARLRLVAQGSGIIRDEAGNEIKFPAQFAKADGVAISLPYTITLFTDTATGEGASTTIGYEGYVATDYGRLTFAFGAPEAGSTTNLVDLTDSVVTPISDLQQFRDEAEAAAAAAAASATSVNREQSSGVAGLTAAGKLYEVRIPDRLSEVALGATYAARTGLTVTTGSGPFSDATRIHATANVSLRGMDLIQGSLFGQDGTNSNFKRSDNDAVSWVNINIPATITFGNIRKVLRFGAFVYLFGHNVTSGTAEVWRAAPVTGATAYTWALVHTLTAGSLSFPSNFNAGSQYLFVADYGDPVGGPRLWRSSDGTTWTQSWTHATSRHVHCVIEDPYNPGHIYMSGGDGGGTSLMKSTDHGATWTIVLTAARHQMVQLSFDADWIYGACDSQQGTFYVIDRATLTPRLGSPNYHYHQRVTEATAAADKFYRNAYYGAVDPATGVYYCVANDTSSPGNWQGMFYCPQAGQRVETLYVPTSGATLNLNWEVFIANGYVWSGLWRRPLLTRP